MAVVLLIANLMVLLSAQLSEGEVREVGKFLVGEVRFCSFAKLLSRDFLMCSHRTCQIAQSGFFDGLLPHTQPANQHDPACFFAPHFARGGKLQTMLAGWGWPGLDTPLCTRGKIAK
jgi:hypothetical protein